MANSRELIALDIGQARTGLARASTIARLAEPMGSVETGKLLGRLDELMADHDVKAVIVGLPRNLKGEDTPQTKWVRQFVDSLKTELEAELYWQDEALTSREAAKEQRAKSKERSDEHARAATMILQDWIDTPEVERVRC